jgi:hypothetical protein
VSHLRWLQVTDDALALAMGTVNDDLDRIRALNRATGCRATSAHQLSQLPAQFVVEGFVKAHPDKAALAWSQTDPTVKADRDVHARADQPPSAIGATHAAAPIGAKRPQRGRREGHTHHPGRIARSVRRHGAQSNPDTHDGLLFWRLGKR